MVTMVFIHILDQAVQLGSIWWHVGALQKTRTQGSSSKTERFKITHFLRICGPIILYNRTRNYNRDDSNGLLLDIMLACCNM
eukprot:5551202-Pleurochrysis_carterae.AAC.3